MKNVKITMNDGRVVSDQNRYEDPTEFINHIVSTNYWGKPIRWVRARISITDSNGQNYIYPDGVYVEEDIIGTEDQLILNTDVTETYVQLKAEYEIEITDVTTQLANEARVVELRKLLADSDFRMTNDYYDDMTSGEQTIWTTNRASWRNELRGLI